MDNLTKRLNELESKRGTFIGSNEYIEGFKEAMKLSEDFIKQLKKLWRQKCKRMDIMSGQVAIFELECILNDLNSVPEVNKVSVPECEVSLCSSCYCMTKTIKNKCGKCGSKK
jgi:hypothetical protein